MKLTSLFVAIISSLSIASGGNLPNLNNHIRVFTGRNLTGNDKFYFWDHGLLLQLHYYRYKILFRWFQTVQIVVMCFPHKRLIWHEDSIYQYTWILCESIRGLQLRGKQWFRGEIWGHSRSRPTFTGILHQSRWYLPLPKLYEYKRHSERDDQSSVR